MPTRFKSYWDFIKEFFDTVLIKNAFGRPYPDIRGFKLGKAAELQNILRSISTQRKRKEVMPWLPEKDYQQVRLPTTPEQKKYLSELENFFCAGSIIAQGVLDRLIRYRQICLHPDLLGLKGSSPKLEYIQDYLADYPERPTIIFSKFTSFLKILDKELPQKKGLIIGETEIKQRKQLIDDFQCGKINLLLLQIDTCKEAITLDRAEVAIFTDKYPPVGDILQAEDRFIATTEARANKSHTIIELMIKGTYDERIYQLIQEHKEAIDIVNDYKKYYNMKGD
jgi:SNF2 family DNA or RNA helicase